MKIFDGVTIAAGGSSLSSAIRLANAKGFFPCNLRSPGTEPSRWCAEI